MLADRLGVAGHRDGTVSASTLGGAAVAVEMAPAFLIAPGGYSILAITGISACNSGPRGPDQCRRAGGLHTGLSGSGLGAFGEVSRSAIAAVAGLRYAVQKPYAGTDELAWGPMYETAHEALRNEVAAERPGTSRQVGFRSTRSLLTGGA